MSNGGWQGRVRGPMAAAAAALVLAGCTGPGASSPPTSPAPSYLEGGVNNGGGGGGQADAGPHTPRSRGVAFFDPAGSAILALGTMESLLDAESYPAPFWYDHADASIDHEAATVAALKGLSSDGIAIVDAWGDAKVLALEPSCDYQQVVDDIHKNYDADLDEGFVEVTAIPGDDTCPNQLNHDEQAWTQKIALSDPNRLVVYFPKSVADPGPVKWAIGITPKGLDAYLGHNKLSLLVMASCDSATLTSGLAVDAVFSYAGCGSLGSDIVLLFNALYGLEGDHHRATDTAYEAIKSQASPGLTYQQSSGAVTLSPALIETQPQEGAYLEPGKTTQVTLTFDTEMEQLDVATLAGCDAEIDGPQTWSADRTKVQFNVKIPPNPQPSTNTELYVRVSHFEARASEASGWDNYLSGNRDADIHPVPNGVGPNETDYELPLTCVHALQLSVDGSFDGKDVKGQLIGQGQEPPRVTCDPVIGFDGSVAYMHVQVWGLTADSHTTVAADWTAKIGTSPIGDQVGASSFSFDMSGVPQRHLGGVSGSVTATTAGGSIDATGSDGFDSLHIVGTWMCPGGSPAP